MGYRNYIGSLPKVEYDKIKNLTIDEIRQLKKIDEEDYYIGIHDFDIKELHEFGKYVEFGDEKFYTPFFLNKQVQEHIADEHDFYIVTKEFLKHIIEHYTEVVKKWYEEVLPNNISPKDLTEKQLESVWNHLRSIKSEWCYLTPYNLEKGDEITTSWKYEYSVFELVRLYKHFDFENNIMIYYGY